MGTDTYSYLVLVTECQSVGKVRRWSQWAGLPGRSHIPYMAWYVVLVSTCLLPWQRQREVCEVANTMADTGGV